MATEKALSEKTFSKNKQASMLKQAVEQILSAVGEDPNREGLSKTPARVAKMYEELCAGYKQTLDEVVNGAIFHETAAGIVLVKDIEFYSLCEHHMLPFYGLAHIAYFPDQKIIGLSKIPRIVEMYARRLQVQERLTTEVREAIDQMLQPKGTAIIVEAQHLCVMMRGVNKTQASMVTTSYSGIFQSDEKLRQEFHQLVYRQENN
ncbi:MAG: GTP cyclohydrolase I FolE [Chloroflexi bacterium]|nr:GTP cyclohydrolase I FolE [Chloroflexota bacterium]